MESTTHLIWHWKLFDLAVPLRFLENQEIDPQRISGLLCREPFGSPEEYGTSFLGINRMSEGRIGFYQQCLDLLRRQYNESGLELKSSELSATDYLHSLGESPENYVVWYTAPSGSEEHAYVTTLASSLPGNVTLQLLPTNTLLQLDELPFDLASMPETFSKFRKKIEKRGYRRYKFASDDLNHNPAHSPARQRVQDYLFNDRRILTYKETRNGLGPGNYSSRLSKWLAVGAISAAEVGSAILQFEQKVEKNEST